MIILDSYAWIEYFLGSDSGGVVKEYLNREEASTPSIVLAEIARKYLREGVGEENIVKRLNFIVAKSNIIEVDVELSITAAKAYLELSKKAKEKRLKMPSLADGIILAAGRILKAEIITGDQHFREFDNVIFLS